MPWHCHFVCVCNPDPAVPGIPLIRGKSLPQLFIALGIYNFDYIEKSQKCSFLIMIVKYVYPQSIPF